MCITTLNCKERNIFELEKTKQKNSTNIINNNKYSHMQQSSGSTIEMYLFFFFFKHTGRIHKKIVRLKVDPNVEI